MKNLLYISKLACLFSLLIFCSTCKKSNTPPTSLPPATQKGANTFGCKVNGEVWVPFYKCDYSFSLVTSNALEVDYIPIPINSNYTLPTFINIHARREENGKSSYFTISATIRGAGNIYDSIKGDELTFADDEGGSFGGNFYQKYYGSTGNFEITKLDTINKIISGTFTFTLYTNATDSIVVTDGRFDFQLKSFSNCSH